MTESEGTIALVKFHDHQAALRKMFVNKNFVKQFGSAQKLFDDSLLECNKNQLMKFTSALCRICMQLMHSIAEMDSPK
jgi:hypothetical protein